MRERLKLIYKYKLKPHTDKVLAVIKSPFRKMGYNLVGFFDIPIGVAEVARQCFIDLELHSIYPVSILNIPSKAHENQGFIEKSPFKEKLSQKAVYKTNIIFINADYIVRYMDEYLSDAQGTRNVGVFFWELEDYFYFNEGVNATDEIIVFSEFVQKAILKTYPQKKVTKFPFPYSAPEIELEDVGKVRAKYGLNTDDFVFFFNFDFFSVYERKNPEGLVKAFSKAFQGNKKVKLFFKTLHGNRDNSNYQKLSTLLKTLDIEDQVIIEDSNMSKNGFFSLLNSSDAYISLHRSEGLGIGMMEAMLLKKPVIATNYGGNLEFTTSETALMVDYELITIQNDQGPYLKGYKWAEPVLEDATKKMLRIFQEPELRKNLVDQASLYLENNHLGGQFSKELDKWLSQSI